MALVHKSEDGTLLEIHISTVKSAVLNLSENNGESFISYDLCIEDFDSIISVLKDVKRQYEIILSKQEL